MDDFNQAVHEVKEEIKEAFKDAEKKRQEQVEAIVQDMEDQNQLQLD